MKHNAKRSIVALLLAVALVASFAFAGAATLTEKTISVKGGVDVYMDGAAFEPTNVNGESVEAFINDGTTYLPIRAIAEALDMVVGFDLESGSVYVNGVVGAAPSTKAAEYIKHYFGVEFNETVTTGEWNAAVATVLGDENPAMTMELAPALNAAVVISAVQAAGLQELAETYTAEKADETLKSAGVTFEMPEGDAAAYYACALDANLIAPTLDPNGDLDGETAAELLMGVAQTSGHGRNYIGRISDTDILSNLQHGFDQIMRADLYNDVVLGDVGYQIMEQDATTGFGIRCTAYNCNFIPEYTIRYGHSEPKHAIQLVALLDSEGIDAYLQIEPKLSIYEGMAAWVDPNADPTERASAVADAVFPEYDLMIEFDTAEDKDAFSDIVSKYCKKNFADQKEDGSFEGLIFEPWWQPLFSSSTEMGAEDYTLIYDNVIKNGNYEIHSFSMPENVEKVGNAAKSVSEDVEIEDNALYVNNAFYRYLSGTGAD